MSDPFPAPTIDISAELASRHYSYECKAAVHQRPYVSRPSRTKQLENPALRPKLNSDVPNELHRKKGVADEQLEQIQQERKRKADADSLIHGTEKRSRSVSSHSSSSVTTISTNLSRSPSPMPAQNHRTFNVHHPEKAARHHEKTIPCHGSMSDSPDPFYKRDRSTTSNGKGQGSQPGLGQAGGAGGVQNDRPRPGMIMDATRKRRRSRSSSTSSTSDSSHSGRPRSRCIDEARRIRPRRSRVIPDIRGRDRWSRASRSSRSSSMDRSQIARGRRSMTPVQASREERIEMVERRREDQETTFGFRSDNDRYGNSFRDKEFKYRKPPRPRPASLSRKERSLSPFSKRIALTQAMSMGR
ncbi:MAG: hypothetical protein Q9182_002685 [Xanthomendoza sp. 2 TL-2023]